MRTVDFIYTNHRGETRRRFVKPLALEWITKPGFGYEAGWFLRGIDVERTDQQLERSFALTNISLAEDWPDHFTLLRFDLP